MEQQLELLKDIFRETRRLLRRPKNDFAWSSWADAGAALAEIDQIIDLLLAGKMPDPVEMRVLFAPTGPIQEVSLSSGWANEFLFLAARFDAAMECR